jgi:hypothetical protein
MAPLSDVVFPNQRNLISGLSENITKMINCLFEKMISGLLGQLGGLLKKGLGLDDASNPAGLGAFLEKLDTQTVTPEDKAPKVPMCYVESLTGDVLAANKDDIIGNVGSFMEGITSQINAASSGLTDLAGAIPSIDGIAGDMASALNFDNIKFSVFGCDFDPLPSVSDLYTFATGSGAEETAQDPNISEVSDKASADSVALTPEPTPTFATPARDEADVDLVRGEDDIDQALQDAKNNVPPQPGDLDIS